MQAYLNNSELKIQTIEAMKADIETERLVKGRYWNGRNGCFVGCVVRSDSHADFELKLGIPKILARLADAIFEGLEYNESKKFSVDFLEAIATGADLTGIWNKFAHFMLIDPEYGVIKFANTENTKKSIQDIADMYQRKINGEKIDVNEWLEKLRAADADADADAAYAAAAARQQHYSILAGKLIKLLKEAV